MNNSRDNERLPANMNFLKPSIQLWHPLGYGLLATLLMTLVGCGPSAEIAEYTIDNRMPESFVQADRMLGAIVPIDDAVWYYKIVADKSNAESVQQEFQSWIKKLSYQDGEPKLETPETWIRIPPGMMQRAKFQIPKGDAMIEMSVSRLGRSGEWNSDVVRNVNRWRGQMGLDPVSTEWAGGEPFEVEDEAKSETAIWVVLDGEFKKRSPMGSPPMMGSPMGPPKTPVANSGTGAPAKKLNLTFDTPQGWSQSEATGMRLAAFQLTSDSGGAEVTLIEAGGDIRQNLAMWLSQVKPDSEPGAAVQELLDGATKVTVLSKEGTRYRLFGSDKINKAIDVAVVPLEDGSQLFIKMTGDPTTVREASKQFASFLSSIKTKEG